ncbi:prepilin-type N-terminal cleavage/methylation domain-containing protein [Desulfosporosinus fructosivorans]|uniref:Prepilin-type N-terminal cleavage/methylation domain-containing protein n=1 Tax=Desulfosporosinus fructosivorans TaxID=2018669 RepID=A0A4Z0R879_9FIRM|nr:prepilin-type N-terminal cleavage/methylation domain-containing protein [Desulfosporosinus fructosivorans]TGE37826.1 prepilin-type N-terminal cleavage/methylation domain-containing protein [Desulfosporosinus fructosivorans]
MNYIKQDNGFTLIEVLAVIIIIGVLGAVAIPKLVSSTTNARQKADVATAHQVKAALDRFQLDTGAYPIDTDLTIKDGVVTGEEFIPKYISKLDTSTTQQAAPSGGKKGFGTAQLEKDYSIPNPELATNTIMIYLSSDGLAAEVRAYDETLKNVLWTSAN